MQIENSKRLCYALMTQNDGELLYELDQDREVMRFINGGVLTTQDEIENVYLPRLKQYTNQKNGWGLWKVFTRENHDYIGWILIRPVGFFGKKPDYNNLEMGWRFFKKSWGKGFAIEAAESIKMALIAQTNINTLSAIANEANLASINIMKKLGMKYIKKYLHKDPIYSEEVVYYELDVRS